MSGLFPVTSGTVGLSVWDASECVVSRNHPHARGNIEEECFPVGDATQTGKHVVLGAAFVDKVDTRKGKKNPWLLCL